MKTMKRMLTGAVAGTALMGSVGAVAQNPGTRSGTAGSVR